MARIIFFNVRDAPLLIACLSGLLIGYFLHKLLHRITWEIFTWEPKVFLGLWVAGGLVSWLAGWLHGDWIVAAVSAAAVAVAPLFLFRASYWPASIKHRIIMGILWGASTPLVIPLGTIAITLLFARLGLAGSEAPQSP
ncbi:MAG: hypothetical protein AAGD22_06590 [Verrucomicrobiota bacterium]